MCHGDSAFVDQSHDHIGEQFLTFPLESGRVFASMFLPEGEPVGSVLLVSDIFGRSPFYRALGRRLAAAGYATLLPEMFSRLWPVADGDEKAGIERAQQLDQAVTLDELEALVAHLRAQLPRLGVGVMGFCLGGTLAMLLAARVPLEAGVIYYGGTAPRPKTALAPYSLAEELPRIQAPLIGFWGEKDEVAPLGSVLDASAILQRHGIPHDFRIYPSLGHAFLTFDPRDRAHGDSARSWDAAMAFLGQHLGQGAGTA